jgi:RHS repeat-associated protein
VSAPPSAGQTVRNDTTYAHFDNGWVRTSTDAWDIATSYDYSELGQQTLRTLTSGGGSSARSMSWSYFPDGKLAGRGDDGVPAGAHVVLVDNSDTPNVATTGTWATATAGSGYQGYDYRTHPAGGTDKLTWTLHIPADGNYQVYVRYPAGVTGAATSASYTVTHTAGSTAKSVNQTQSGGQWVSLGSFGFTEGGAHSVALAAGSTGTVLADAVKLVRDTTGQTDAEAKDFTYAYDPNGNLIEITDTSSGAAVDRYAIGYTGLNQVASVAESDGGVVAKTTTFTYDVNGNPLTRSHDDQYASYAYDVRDLVSRVSNGESASDPDPKVTTYSYTARGQRLLEVKANGNTVDYGYYLDGLLAHQVETKANGTVVAEHTIGYDPNGNRVQDVARTMNADNHAAHHDRTYDYSYDPRDRIATVVKSDTSSGSTLSTETYLHDAASNVISQTLQGVTTTFGHDRNRLLTATTGGQTAAYNYDPFGRLNTVTAAGQVLERYVYDGFDRIAEHTKTTVTATTETTSYTYDPLDRTTSRTDNSGSAGEETTDFAYLGLSGEVLSEEIAGEVQKSYQYSPWGQRLSQITHNTDGTEQDGYYGYNPHTDVETLTDTTGDTVATYGYTAYGTNDEAEFTGIDAPDPQNPDAEPYNVYRYNAKRWDPASGSYDMGFRDYSPGLNRFLTRDLYTGALAELNLATSPWNNNRYAFAAGNPITGIELDGHRITQCDGPCAEGDPGQWENPVTGQVTGTQWTPDDDTDERAVDPDACWGQCPLDVIYGGYGYEPWRMFDGQSEPLDDILRALLGIADLEACLGDGDWSSCGWFAAGFIPGLGWGKRADNAIDAIQAAKTHGDNALRTVTALTREQDAALSAVMRDPNRLEHIFGQAGKHNLASLTDELGGHQAVVREAILRVPRSQPEGVFKITSQIGPYPITVTGRMMNGVPRLSNIWVQ